MVNFVIFEYKKFQYCGNIGDSIIVKNLINSKNNISIKNILFVMEGDKCFYGNPYLNNFILFLNKVNCFIKKCTSIKFIKRKRYKIIYGYKIYSSRYLISFCKYG